MSTGQQGTCRFHLPQQLHLRRRSSGQSNRTVDSLFNLVICSVQQHVLKSLFNLASHAKVCTIHGFIAHFTQWSITSMFTRFSTRSRADNDEPVERPDEHLNLIQLNDILRI